MRSGGETPPSTPGASPDPLDPAAAAHAIANGLLELLAAVGVVVYRVDPDSGDLEVVAAAGNLGPAWPPGFRHPRGMGAAGLALSTRTPVITDDVLADPRIRLTVEARREIEQAPSRAILALPLTTQGEVVGALGVGDRPGRRFTAAEGRLAQAFADQAAAVLRNAQRYDEALRRGREAVIVAEAARALNATLDLPTVLELVLRGARELCRSDMASIALRDPGTGEMRHRYMSGGEHADPTFTVAPGKGVGGTALLTGEPFRTDHYAEDPRISKDYLGYIKRERVTTSIVVPIMVGDQIDGLLYAQNREPRPFTDEDEAVLVRLAGHASTAIRNARLYAQAQAQLAQTETLLAVTRSLTAALDITETMRLVSREVAHALKADLVGAFVPDADGGLLRPLAGYHVPIRLRVSFRELSFRLDEHPVLLTARLERRTVFEPRARAVLSLPPAVAERLPEGSALFVPMFLKEELIGGLFAMWCPPREAPGPDELRLAEAIAGQAALFAANARSYQELDRRQRSADGLAEVGRLIGDALKPGAVARLVVDYLHAFTGGESVFFSRLDPVSRHLATLAVAGDLSGLEAIGDPRVDTSIGGLAVAERRTVITDDLLEDKRFRLPARLRAALGRAPNRALLIVPLTLRTRVVGVLGVADKAGRRFDPDEIAMVETLASEAATALERTRLVVDLRRALRSVTALSRRLLAVQEQERWRIARELHDEIGQYLTGLSLTLDVAARDAGAAQQALLEEARTTAEELIERVRDLATELRPPVLDDLGLLDTLAGHLARFTRQTGVTVAFDTSHLDGRRLPPDLEVAAYRIVQEALTNVARHARVGEARVWLAVRGTALAGGVEDRGVGCNVSRLGSRQAVGLAGMRERAQIMGGRLTLESVEGQGTRVSFELPLTPPRGRRGRDP